MWKHLTTAEAGFLPNTPTRNRPTDFKFPPSTDSARLNHRRHLGLVSIFCYHSRHRQYLIWIVFRIARTVYSYSEAWRTLWFCSEFIHIHNYPAGESRVGRVKETVMWMWWEGTGKKWGYKDMKGIKKWIEEDRVLRYGTKEIILHWISNGYLG
jgi:hypothetical protein